MNSDETSGNLIISQAREFLSPYLDGEVTAAERDLVENALAQSPQLQRELESLRQSVALFKAMPRAAAPRPFTLSAATAGIVPPKAAKRNWLKWAMGGISAVAAIAIVLAVGVTLFNPASLGGKNNTELALAPAPEMAQESTFSETNVLTEAPMVANAAVAESTETAPAVEMMKAAEAPSDAPEATTDGAVAEEERAVPLAEVPAVAEMGSMVGAVAPMADAIVACDILPADDFIDIWQNNPQIQNALGCPTDPHPRTQPAAYPVKTAVQPFEKGSMIWSDQVAWYPQAVIWVINADGTFLRFDDTFNSETDAVAGDELPPDRFFAPILGFGKVWRTEADVRESLGWATAEEQSGEGVFQMFEGGDMLRLSQDNRTYVFLSAENRVEIFDNVEPK